jgi:hypothetical protein
VNLCINDVVLTQVCDLLSTSLKKLKIVDHAMKGPLCISDQKGDKHETEHFVTSAVHTIGHFIYLITSYSEQKGDKHETEHFVTSAVHTIGHFIYSILHIVTRKATSTRRSTSSPRRYMFPESR